MWWGYLWCLTWMYPLSPYVWYVGTLVWKQRQQAHQVTLTTHEYERLCRQMQIMDLRLQQLTKVVVVPSDEIPDTEWECLTIN